jgi:hypothetical protein
MEQSRYMCTASQEGIYRFEYDTRYSTAKSDPPTLVKISLRGNQLHYLRVEIPRFGTGTKIVRLKGSYTAVDGDVFLSVDGSYAEILVVYHGFQFALWWGDPEDALSQDLWLSSFLAQNSSAQLHVIPKLEEHLEFIRDRSLARPGEKSALTDLIASLRKSTASENGSEDLPANPSVLRPQ